MTSIAVRTGTISLHAPLPPPRRYDLLATAPITEPTDDRWLTGGTTGGEIPGPAFTHDSCSVGTDRSKVGSGIIGEQTAATFSAYLVGSCTAQSVGRDPTRWIERLKTMFALYEGAAVERVLSDGDGHLTLGPSLADENMELLNSGDPLPTAEALGLLEQAVARHVGGMLHVGPRTLVALDARGLVRDEQGVLVTRLGTPVAVGYGYVGARPDAAAAGAREEWAFASGPIEILRGRVVDVIPEDYSEAMERSLNDVTFIAERPYLLNWLGRTSPDDGDHTQAGLLVDLSADCSVDGGSP